NAVVVPVNPMNRTAELEHFVKDTGARIALVGQELFPLVQPLLGCGLDTAVVANYADYADPAFDLPTPEVAKAATRTDLGAGTVLWRDALAAGERPGPATAGPDVWSVFPYSSGTTGNPKGCVHTHRTVMATVVGVLAWSSMTCNSTT